MKHSLLYAILISLVSVSETSAQTTAETPGDFSGLSVGRTITIVPDKGWPIRGRVRSVTPDQLTLAVKGREIVLNRTNVVSAFEKKTFVKRGMIIGLLAGTGLGLAAVASDGSDYAQAAAGMFVVLGLGIGAGVGAMIPTSQVLYERPKSATSGAGAFSIAPSFGPSRARLQMTVAW